MLFYVMLFYVMLILCYVMLCYVMVCLFYVMLCYIILCYVYVMLCYILSVLNSFALWCMSRPMSHSIHSFMFIKSIVITVSDINISSFAKNCC